MNFEKDQKDGIFILSFVVSFLIHLFFLELFIKWMDDTRWVKKDTIEVTLKEKKDSSDFKRKKGTFIEDTKSGKIVKKEDVKKSSRYVSKFFRRVEEESIASRQGNQFLNALPFFAPQNQISPLEKGTGSFLSSPHRRLYQSSVVDFDAPNVKKGFFTALNLDPYKFYAFSSRTVKQIVPRYRFNIRRYLRIMPEEDLRDFIDQLTQAPLRLDFEVILNAEGHYKRAIIHKSFGFKELDHAAIDAVEEASPLLNPPKDMISEEDGKIHLLFSASIH